MNDIVIQVATTALAFLIFFWISKKLFWTSIIQTIEARQARIRGEFDAIDDLKRKVEGMEAQYARQLADIEATARNKMQEATAHGKQIAEQIADQARKDADAALERNKQVIAIEMEKAREELRQEVVEMTMTATERIIKERLDDPKHRQLVSSFKRAASCRSDPPIWPRSRAWCWRAARRPSFRGGRGWPRGGPW